MADILDFLAIEAPEVYARTKYRIIEISDRLVGKQKGSVAGGWREEGGMSEGEMGKEKARRRGHGDRVEVIGKSIFEWDRVVHEPCFFIAMEVLVRISFSLSHLIVWLVVDLTCILVVSLTGQFRPRCNSLHYRHSRTSTMYHLDRFFRRLQRTLRTRRRSPHYSLPLPSLGTPLSFFLSRISSSQPSPRFISSTTQDLFGNAVRTEFDET